MASKLTLLRKNQTLVDDRRALSRLPGCGIALVRPEVSGKTMARSGRIVDFSKSGIALLLRYQFSPGTVLALSPIGWIRSSPLEAEVVHCREMDGHWLHGCRFVEKLNKKDMEHFFSFNLKIT